MRRSLFGCFVFVLIAGGCSSSDDTSSSSGGPQAGGLATGANALCVTPSASAQDIELPATGGVTATISFAAFPGGAGTRCDGVKIATGGNVQTVGIQALHPRTVAGTTPTRPILTIGIGEAFDINPVFDAAQVVTNVVLKTSPDLNFPDGIYYMTITRRSGRVDIVQLTATGGVLTVAPVKSPNGNDPLPVLIVANSSAVLRIYPNGVTPTIFDIDSPPQTIDLPPGELPALPATPPEHTNPMQGSFGLPPPNAGVEMGNSISIFTPGCSGNPGCTSVRPIFSNGGSPAAVDGVAGMVGTVSFQANIGYMAIQSVAIDCPSYWDVSAGVTGSGTINIPASSPFVGETCTIDFSTIPPQGGSGYGVTLKLRGLDIGAH